MILINYLHNYRSFWKLQLHLLNNIKEQNLDKFIFNIATRDIFTESYWDEYLYGKCKFTYKMNIYPNSINYMMKVRDSVNTDAEYIIKCDEDCFLAPYVWDYLIENISILNDADVLCITPAICGAIPHIDYFLEDFATRQERRDINNSFLTCTFDRPYLNGYPGKGEKDPKITQLNKFTLEADHWNAEAFYEYLNEDFYPGRDVYKGFHPIGDSKYAQIWSADLIKKNIQSYLDPKSCYLYDGSHRPWMRSGIYAMKTDLLRKFISEYNPKFDDVDELFLNFYQKKTGKKILYLRNAFGFHMFYSVIPGYRRLEQEYYGKILQRLEL